MTTWHVYQFRSDTELLYVGQTRWLNQRLSQHKCRKAWWSEVTEVRVEEFVTEDEARQREKVIWASERPKYNQVNPFRTVEEWRERQREAERKYERKPHRRQAQRKYQRTAEYRQRAQQRKRSSRMRLQRRWQQDGPGLF